MADFVLIHGTTQGPQGWERLAAALGSNSHRSVAVDLLSSQDHDVRHYVEAVKDQVPAEFTSPIVIAHSGSGVLLPATARALGARHQVWLAAFVPDGHRSFLEEVRPSPTEVFSAEWLGKDPTSDPTLAAYFLFHDCDLATLQWALTTLRIFAPQRLYEEPLPLAPAVPSTYIVATRDRTLRPDWCRREAVRRLGAEVIEIDAGHGPHVSQADEHSAILNDLDDRSLG
jgi:pimeloyl-ACP methyl ester carboxylesterase